MLPDKHLERLLKQRQIYCLLRGSGCRWTGLKDIHNHLNFDDSEAVDSYSFKMTIKCRYLPIPCSYCEEYVRRMNMEIHKGQCNHRPCVCKHCSDEYLFKDQTVHFSLCPMYPVYCSNRCSYIVFKRKDLEPHLANDCLLQQVDCEYSYAGCRERRLWRDMDDHMERKLREHLGLVTIK